MFISILSFFMEAVMTMLRPLGSFADSSIA